MKWDIWNSAQYDPTQVTEAIRERAGSDLMAAVLWARGIQAADEIDVFLGAGPAKLHNPMQMAGMAEGVARIRNAIETGEQVAVYGDYDADGVTATALMADFLRAKGLSCAVHIPDRLEDGYGLNLAALESLAAAGVTLVVTVDCGVTAREEVVQAKTLGIDMIITDHHECQGDLPKAVAVINPKRPDCSYPDKELSGVGVAFQYVSAVEGPAATTDLLLRYSDLVAVGTVADVMDLRGENRVFVTEGLRSLRAGARAGFRCLLQDTTAEQAALQSTGISFQLAPRLNAAGRMGNAMLAYHLLETADPGEAAALAEQIKARNEQRQKVEQTILEEALDMLGDFGYERGPIVLHSSNWHKGVLGIVSARLKERYQEPVILLCVEDGVGRGSCRGVEGFDLVAALTACGDTLERFGGHQQAAGLTLPMAELERFKALFEAYYNEHPPETEGRTLQADFTLTDPALIALNQVQSLERLEPCGKGNPSPVLVIEEAILQKVIPIGGGKHVKLQVEKWGKSYDCVFFGTTREALGAREGDLVDLAFTPQINRFRGKTTVQFLITDLGLTHRRLVSRAKRLSKSLLAGHSPTADEVRRFHPNREDFVQIWLRLKRGAQGLQGPLHQVLAELTQNSCCAGQAKAYLCLQVLHELELAIVREVADTLHIELCESAEKVDLSSSRVMQALQKSIL